MRPEGCFRANNVASSAQKLVRSRDDWAFNWRFEDAWRSLDRGIGPDTDAIRERLARHIITLAQTGERDVIRLRDGAVAYVMGALQRIEAMRQSSVRDPSRSQMPTPPAAH